MKRSIQSNSEQIRRDSNQHSGTRAIVNEDQLKPRNGRARQENVSTERFVHP